jgi:hypothetical protein
MKKDLNDYVRRYYSDEVKKLYARQDAPYIPKKVWDKTYGHLFAAKTIKQKIVLFLIRLVA